MHALQEHAAFIEEIKATLTRPLLPVAPAFAAALEYRPRRDTAGQPVGAGTAAAGTATAAAYADEP